MPEKHNSAARIHSLLRQAWQQPESLGTHEVWKRVFSIPTDNIVELRFTISHIMHTMYDELNIIYRSALNLFTAEFISDAFQNINLAIDVSQINKSWSTVRNHCTPDKLDKLAMISQVLQINDYPVNEDFIQNIVTKLKELKNIVSNSETSIEVKDLLNYYILSIEKSLYRYRIVGERAIVEEFNQIMFRLLQDENDGKFDNFQNPEAKENVISKLGDVLRDFAEHIATIDNLVKPFLWANALANTGIPQKLLGGLLE